MSDTGKKPQMRFHYKSFKECIDINREVIHRYLLFSKKMDRIGAEFMEDIDSHFKKQFDKAVDEAVKKALDVHDSEMITEKDDEKKAIEDEELTMPSSVSDEELGNENVTDVMKMQLDDTSETSDSDNDDVEFMKKPKRAVSPTI